jgi:hypothetical protein
VFVLARGPVGAGASAQFDLALVEVFLESEPLGLGDFPVLIGGAGLATPVQECLVMADDVLVEDGDVAPGRFKVQVPEQGCADMDRQPVVHQIGGQQPAEVVRGEARRAELRMTPGEVVAAPAEHDQDGGGGDDPASRSELPLEQEGHRLAHPAFMLVIALDERDYLPTLGVAADDCRDDGEQFSRHRDDTLPVGLGRGDDQQRDTSPLGR